MSILLVLLDAVNDVAHPSWGFTSLGVYRFQRDSGDAFGVLAVGGVADALGLLSGFWFAQFIMVTSGALVVLLIYETVSQRRPGPAAGAQASSAEEGQEHIQPPIA